MRRVSCRPVVLRCCCSGVFMHVTFPCVVVVCQLDACTVFMNPVGLGVVAEYGVLARGDISLAYIAHPHWARIELDVPRPQQKRRHHVWARELACQKMSSGHSFRGAGIIFCQFVLVFQQHSNHRQADSIWSVEDDLHNYLLIKLISTNIKLKFSKYSRKKELFNRCFLDLQF